MNHLIDTPPKISECNRCKSYVLAGISSGCRYAVDMSPLTPPIAAALIISGIKVYRASKGKISMLTSASNGYEGLRLMAHSCGCSALDASAFEVVEPTPQSAPATQETAVFGSQGLSASVVADVRSHRSEVARCSLCDNIMDEHTEKIMVEIPVWQENTLKVPNRGSRKGYTRDFKGWGYTRWAIHPDGCPANTHKRQR